VAQEEGVLRIDRYIMAKRNTGSIWHLGNL